MSEEEKGLLDKKEAVGTVENVQSIFFSYNENLNSVKLYFSKFGNLATGEDDNIKESFESFFEEVVEDLESNKKTVLNPETDTEEEVIDDEYIKKALSLFRKRPNISPRNYEILSRSSFLMLNNYFEYLLTDLLSYFYNKYQNSLDEKEFRLTLKELNEFETIEEATKNLILKEVESIIVEKTFNELLIHFEKQLSISLENDLINWNKIIEIRERRHLIVHNSSIVNKKYITRTGNPYDFKIGEPIHVQKDYFENSCNELKIAGQLLLFNCWGKWDKDNIDNAIYQIMLQTFEDLKFKNNDAVRRMCEYSNQIIAKNENQEDYLFRIKVNHAIALKKSKSNKDLAKVLKTMKVGTATPIFKIAFKILNDDHKDLSGLFKKAVVMEELNREFYLEWPIFDFVRINETELHKELLQTFN
ncbi:hypothetical protein [Dokdonia sp. 4H-3-7-5]|uniref:hypothetical protein n=1 Tax=Dokdonia sp. (strain 4H-3-7-5) TaxID=983548 RepID=UPI00020A6BE1|nr:hypothetical protein [Dokdonia sp. 4H-3-7-5]AEE19619.1 hypothetical protein Krodi_1636 [Dokdonia sp. 4H-3-7-5]